MEREVVGAVEDEWPMLPRKGGSEWVEFQEAWPSRVMYLGCVVADRGRIGRLGRDTFSCPGRVSSTIGRIWGAKETWPGYMGEALKFAVEENGWTARVLVDSWGLT